MPVSNQTQCSVSLVFVLDAFGLTGLHRDGDSNPFQRLKSRHFIDADRVRIRLKIQLRSLTSRLTDDFDLSLKNGVILLCGVQPVLAAMRLQF